MNDRFFDWLIRKYGWGREEWEEDLDEDFQKKLVREYASIAASYWR